MPGIRLSVVEATGAPLGEGRLGEIVAAGPWVAEGYQGAQAGGPSSFQQGRLCTGDAGFLLDGELFVLGRMGDSTKVRGRSLYAEDVEDVEARLAAIPGVPPVGWWWCSDGSMGWTPSRRWSNASGERGSSLPHAGSAAKPAAGPGC